MIKKFHLQDQIIPDGFQIFEERLDISGVHHRKKEVAKFIKGENLNLVFEREKDNKYDSNAIKIMGTRKGFLGTRKTFLGYVPSDVASKLVDFGYENFQPRLLKTYLSKSEYVEVLFQVLGPKEKFRYYKEIS